MRGATLASSLTKVAGAAIAMLEANLRHHPSLRGIDQSTLSCVTVALFEAAAALVDRTAPVLDPSAASPYSSLTDALRAISRAIRVFIAAQQAQQATSEYVDCVSHFFLQLH